MCRVPQTFSERNEGIIRTVALMRHLASIVGVKNAYQFAKWFDGKQNTFNRASTAASGKWSRNFSGQVSLKGEQLDLLERLIPDARRFYEQGPADLWTALWSDPVNLWPLCRTRYCDDGPEIDDRIWTVIKDELKNERTLDTVIAEFEANLLLAQHYGEPLTIRHLSEGIALFRLYHHINALTRINADGAGLYQSIVACLADINVCHKLNEIVGFDRIQSAIYGVIQNLEIPLERIDSKSRWEVLGDRLAWVSER
ncbi:MAG: hypothetical protein EO766_16385 [Hydrotalea sp. AMD]|uniref:hypothetical protein n=1 Tax=Hydrotalea sp. AMD TaxID=2501297 RepID=UPI001025765C|nr:hypothetical protein [Hydrotalea sp. AMD]RWZ85642.1 MAG: hypothetical protein EO766_16385 [Hydrotalea sp. AMD]